MADEKNTSAVSVSNLVNLTNLERVFGDVFDKLSRFSSRLDKLENDLLSNVSLTRFLSLKKEYESNISLFENRINFLEKDVSSLKPLITQTKYNQESIDKMHVRSKEFVTKETFDSNMNDFELTLNDKIQQISTSKCSNNKFKKLEESTKIMSQQISGMESILQCKVDKSQVPIIESCQKQLDSLEHFRDQISQRVCIVDDQISDINNDLNSKLNQEAFDAAQNEIEQVIMKKVDMSFLNEEVIKRLNTLLPDLLILLKEHKQITASQCLNEIKIIQNDIKSMNDKYDINKSNIDSILKSLYNIPSLQQMEIKADKEYCNNLNQESKQFCINNCNKIETTINGMNKEISKLKIISNSLTEKTKVALRFVDWYSSLQLET